METVRLRTVLSSLTLSSICHLTLSTVATEWVSCVTVQQSMSNHVAPDVCYLNYLSVIFVLGGGLLLTSGVYGTHVVTRDPVAQG